MLAAADLIPAPPARAGDTTELPPRGVGRVFRPVLPGDVPTEDMTPAPPDALPANESSSPTPASDADDVPETLEPGQPVEEPVEDLVVPQLPPVVPVTPPVGEVPRLGESWSDNEIATDLDEDAEDDEDTAPKKKSRSRRGLVITERDLALFQFLTRYRFATYPQISAYTGVAYSALRHRLPRLEREGLLVREPIGQFKHGVWLPTAAAVRLADLDLPTPALSWATVGHTLGLVDIGIRYEHLGETVVTEREIRAVDGRGDRGRRPSDRIQDALGMVTNDNDDEPLYVAVLGSGPKAYRHIPDLVLAREDAPDGSPRSVAIELELVHKPQTQWVKIMNAYRRSRTLGQVIYFTHKSKIASGIKKAAESAGIAERVEVQKFVQSDTAVVPLAGDR